LIVYNRVILKHRWALGFSTLLVIVSLGGAGTVWLHRQSAAAAADESNLERPTTRVERAEAMRTSLRQAAAAIHDAARRNDGHSAAADLSSARRLLDDLSTTLNRTADTPLVTDRQAQAMSTEIAGRRRQLQRTLDDAADRIDAGFAPAAVLAADEEIEPALRGLDTHIASLIGHQRQVARDEVRDDRRLIRRQLTLAMAPLLMLIMLCTVAAFRFARR
jgi:hypothetical protein